jgi:1,4-dihydroxy-2-naphthoate octaprenyltransferase
MEQEILKKLQELEQKINAVYISAEKTRKYFLWTLIISVVVIVLPLVGALFLIPTLLNSILLPAGL